MADKRVEPLVRIMHSICTVHQYFLANLRKLTGLRRVLGRGQAMLETFACIFFRQRPGLQSEDLCCHSCLMCRC